MKVGILSFQDSDNYGAVLQNYALYLSVRDLGGDVEVIRYRCDFVERPYRLVNLLKRGLLHYLFFVLGWICYLPRSRRFDVFRKRIDYSERVTRKDLFRLGDAYDVLIVGSDQIWNHRLTNSDTSYLLDFARDSARRCSYAASFGVSKMSGEIRAVYGKQLSRFDVITVREPSGIELVSEISGKDASIALDPTLLLDKDKWLALASGAKNGEPYILVYQLGFSRRLVDFASDLARKTGYRVRYVPFPLGGMIRARITLTAGPENFLALIRDAAYVVTDSYHGTIFSIILEKFFFTEVGAQYASLNERITSLLDKLDLGERIIAGREARLDGGIDYEKVNAILARERERSMGLLRAMVL